LSTALGNDPNYYINTNVLFQTKANLSSPHLIGIPTAPTPNVNNSSDQIATTSFVKSAIASSQVYTSFIINSPNPTVGRQINVPYVNLTGQKIEVVITISSGVLTVDIDGLLILTHASANNNTITSVTFSVQPGATYMCSGATLQRWTELR